MDLINAINARLSSPNEHGCRLWKLRCDKDGYGITSWKGRTIRVHRAVWEAANGPTQLLVCHRCDTPACGELSHLFAGTPSDNMRDKVDKGRSLSGAENPNAKLTADRVAELRRLYASGQFTQRGMARRFGIGKSMVNYIVRGVNWRADRWD